MKVGLYAVYDSASRIYDGPVPSNNDEVAMRNFVNMCKNLDSPIGKNPECFSLWLVGSYDDSTGEVEPEVKQCLLHANDVLFADLTKEAN